MLKKLPGSAPYALLLLVACAPKVNQPVRQSLVVPPMPPDHHSPEATAEVVPTACHYWTALTAMHVQDQGRFQMFTNLRVETKSTGNKQEIEVYGRVIPARLPQVLFKTSEENMLPSGKSELEPPNFDEFIKLARSRYDNRNDPKVPDDQKLGFWKYWGVRSVYAFSNQFPSWTGTIRNSGYKDGVEAKLPGAFSREAKRLEKSPLYESLMKSVGITGINSDEEAKSLAMISPEVPLFTSGRWKLRRDDLKTTLDVLELPQGSLSVEDKFCRYALAQRLMAQLISLKGIKGAPKTTYDGGFKKLNAAADTVSLGKQTIPGAFAERIGPLWTPVVVDEAWVTAKLKQAVPHVRAEGAVKTAELLDLVDYLVTLTAHRSKALWTEDLNEKLLKLGIGLYGVIMTELKTTEVVKSADNEISLPNDDSAENLAHLLRIMIARVRSFHEIAVKPTDFEATLFDESQRKTLGAELDVLVTGLTNEAIRRTKMGRGSPALNAAVHAVGVLEDNPYLKTF